MKLLPIACALLLTACSRGADDAQQAPDAVALVSVGRAEQGPVSERIALYGTVDNGVAGKQTLSAPADAIVRSIVAPVGTRVAAGDVIVRLEPAPSARLELVKAGADARAAQDALARLQRLRTDGLVSDAEVETARATATGASATRSSLSDRSARLTLRAPAPGFVETIPVSTGEMLAVGTVVATLAGSGNVRARFGIDPAVVGKLRAGAVVRIVRGGGNAPLVTAVGSIDPTVDPVTRLASVYANIPAASGLSVGQSLQGEVRTEAAAVRLTIPYAALLDDGGQPFVYVVQAGVAHRHDVATGAATGDRIVIASGLRAGDQVVTQGGTAVEDGMKVRTH